MFATAGALAGSVLRQVVDGQQSSEPNGELVIGATPTPILAGTVAGLILPKKLRVLGAILVGANVAANLKTDPFESFVGSSDAPSQADDSTS